MDEGKKKYVVPGVVGAFTAVTCCVAAVVFILLGVGTAVSMAFMHQFHIVSVVSGVILMLLITFYLVKRKSGVCNVHSIKENWKGISLAVVLMFATYMGIDKLVVAPIAGSVYGNLEVKQQPLGNLPAMADSHGMPEMAEIEVTPEEEGEKLINLRVDGIYCGSCGPAILYDVRSVAGVIDVEEDGKYLAITYDSDVTSKDVIMASIHDPYTPVLISEKQVGYRI